MAIAKFKEVNPYVSQYGKGIADLTNKVVNRQAFTYDPNTDAAFQASAKKYERLGDRARQNTLADFSANTGGIASSYAVSAASQAQNDYNQQLADLIPGLMDVAYNRYKSEYDMNNAALSQLQSLDNAAYGKWSDNRAYNRDKYVSDRDYGYRQIRDKKADSQWLSDYRYRQSRDKVTDSQWNQEFGLENKKFSWQKSQSGKSGGGGGSGSRGGSRRSYSKGGSRGGGGGNSNVNAVVPKAAVPSISNPIKALQKAGSTVKKASGAVDKASMDIINKINKLR